MKVPIQTYYYLEKPILQLYQDKHDKRKCFLKNLVTNEEKLVTAKDIREIESISIADPGHAVKKISKYKAQPDEFDVNLSNSFQFLRQDKSSAILIDTTTITNSLEALKDPKKSPHPFQLFDMNALCFCAMFFDRIYYVPNENLKDAKLPEFFSPLEGMKNREILDHFWDSYTRKPLENKVLKGIVDSKWSHRLGIEIEINIDDLKNKYLPSSHEALVLNSKIIALENSLNFKNTDVLNKFVTLHTARTFFNHGLAHRLGISYQASALRGPVIEALKWSVNMDDPVRDSHQAKMIQDLESRPNTSTGEFRMNIPYPLQLVLSDMEELSNFRTVLEERHRKYEEVRCWIAKVSEEKNFLYVDDFLKEVKNIVPSGDSTDKNQVVQTVVNTLGSLAFNNPVSIPVGLLSMVPALKLLNKFNYSFLFDLQSECKNIQLLKPEVERLWEKSPHNFNHPIFKVG